MVITSMSNERVRLVRSLRDGKARAESGLYLAEGINLVKDIPSSAGVHSIYVKESKANEFGQISSKFDCPTFVLSDQLFDRVSDTVAPSGIIAVVHMPNKRELSSISSDKLIILDNVSDSGNVGAVIRTAVAAGYTDIICIGGADPYGSKAVRSSMSGIFKINLYFADYDEFCSSEITSKYDILILDMAGDNIFSYSPQGRFALVVGNEAHGVSDYFMSVSTVRLSIPMHNMESLNAAVSAGIAMYSLSKNNF